MSTYISKLTYKGEEFIPITAADAVVVSPTSVNSIKTITTLDKVLNQLSDTLDNISTGVEENLSEIDLLVYTINNLSAGDGILVDREYIDGKLKIIISSDPNFLEKYLLYELLPTSVLPVPSQEYFKNKIYILPTTETSGDNICEEYICLLKGEIYTWEKIGSIKAELNLSELTAALDKKITDVSERVATIESNYLTFIPVLNSEGNEIYIDYEPPNTLWE